MNPLQPANNIYGNHPLTDAACARRWKRWEGLCAIEAYNNNHHGGSFEKQMKTYKEIHKSRMNYTKSCGINSRTMERHELDSPLADQLAFTLLVNEVLERRKKYLTEHHRRRKMNKEKENEKAVGC